MVGLALLLLMLAASVCSGAVAETVTALEGPAGGIYMNVSFSDGYYGYCIDASKDGAVLGDVFDIVASSAAKNNRSGEDISQKLKVLFYSCFEDIFEKNSDGEYHIISQLENTVLGIIYNYSDNYHYSHELKTKAEGYSGPAIGDENETKTLSNGDIVKFSFKVFEPRKEGQQTFFAYRINTASVVDSENGTVTIERNSGSTEGVEIKVTIEPENGYELDKLIVGGEDVSGSVQDNEYAFMLLDEDVTVQATFKQEEETPVTYTVTATKEGQGMVSLESASFQEKARVVLIIEAESNHKLVSLTRDGVDVTDEVSGNTYIFEMPAKDVNIHAVFEANQAPEYTVTVNESENGSVESDKTRAAKDETVTLTVKPDAGYELDTLVVDGQDVTGSVENDQYAFSMPAEDVTVQVTFKKTEEAPVIYTVTVSDDGNGTAAANPIEGTTGTQVTLSTMPNTGYQFKEWQVVSGGVTIANNEFAIGNENVEVKAIFEAIPEAPVTYTVTFDANGGSGTMEIQTFQQGVEQALTMNAFTYEGHVFDGWNIMPDGSGDALADGETLQLAGNITLYAQWKAETVVNPLRIVKHPEDQYVTAGQQAEFSVEAEGDGVTYQWYIDRMDGKGLCVIDGANDQTYVTSTVNPDNDE